MTGFVLTVLVSTLAGTAMAGVLACLPGLHVFNLMGLVALLILELQAAGMAVAPEIILPLMTGMIVGWCMLNTIPAVLLGAPDESALFTVLPGQKYLMLGRGFEGAMITAVGGLGGVYLLVFVVAPLAPRILPIVQSVLRPYLGMVLWVVTAFMVVSEWPKGGTTGQAGWRKFMAAWSTLAAGLVTLLASGFLGFILMYRSPVPPEMAFQNIMPAFVGLFAVPWCLLNILSGAGVPRQHVPRTLDVDPPLLLRGLAAGGLGGGFAAFFPVITGGMGGLLAGHAMAQRDERVFIMSQGVSKLVYYTGAFMLLFVPGLGITRGGGAWIVKSLYDAPRTPHDYLVVVSAVAISGGLAFLMMEPLARGAIWLIGRVNYRYLSVAALAVILALVVAVTGGVGLYIAVVATGIGLFPVLFGSRRLNCLGILLLPMGSSLCGFGPVVAGWLGLM